MINLLETEKIIKLGKEVILMSNTKRTGQITLYERLSRDDKLQGESNSIINQKQLLESYAKRNGFANIYHYTDDGVRGTTFDIHGFQKMIKAVKENKVSTVIVKDMSRFGSDCLKVGFYTEILFKEKGVRFIAINNGIDSEKQAESDFTPFLNIMNEWYAMDTLKKYTLSSEQEWKKIKEYHQAFHAVIIETLRTNKSYLSMKRVQRS